MANSVILFSKSGCVKCDDFKNAGIYDKIEDLQEFSLEEMEGLGLACFLEMWNSKGQIDTPALYIGKDCYDDHNAVKVFGEDVGEYVKEHYCD